jgi:EAL domain-containing protein (putative c-di-GMP-specific phosphodiesterase class I)/CHASE2 domain-containing sensor protein
VSKRTDHVLEKGPLKLLLWTALAGLVFGLVGFGEIAEDYLRTARNRLHPHQASGQLVVVRIDDPSLRQYGNWPWPRRYEGQLIDRLSAAGANRIFFDILFDYRGGATDDRLFADALRRSGKVTLGTRFKVGPHEGATLASRPIGPIAKFAHLATVSFRYNFQNAAWQLPYAVRQGHDVFPSFAAALGNQTGNVGTNFRVDYSTNLNSIPVISAGDVLSGRVPASQLSGKDVLVGMDSDLIGDRYFIPGYGRAAGLYVHALGAETLRHGKPIDIGWLPGFFIAFAAAAAAVLRNRFAERLAVFVAGGTALAAGPVFLESKLIFADVTPGIFVLVVVCTILGWRRYRVRGLVNTVTGLPNLNALRANRDGRRRAIVTARIFNYEEIVAALPPDSERRLVDQIVSRLKVGSPARVLYQGDGGIFAWFEETGQPVGNHLEALYALFRNPARISGLSMDLTVAFGVEVGSGRSIANRLASALVAADEAAHHGLKWKYHDPETLENASWKLSMLSQLDEAIDRGEVWVAYQPKLDLMDRRIIGAEALARWTHPEKGPIAASEFVAAAEQSNRIGKLTDFVLEKAVGAAAQINKRGLAFDIAVNLSARLLTDKGFTLRLSALLARHGLAPQRLTLELTETAALSGSGEGLDMIARLRELGINIAIDDYGTGLSTLEYLKKIPASEIKIDQSFVKGMVDNRSDRLMVQSTIGLAHSLDRKVVAEGVEHRETLDLLSEMGCDIAQGFAIGRPMSIDSLTKRLASERKRTAA